MTEYSNWWSFACDFVSMSEGPNAKTPITSKPPVNILDTFQNKKEKRYIEHGWKNYYIQTHLRVGGLINLAKTIVSVPHKGLKYRLSGKSSRTRNWRSCSWVSKTNPVFQLVNKPSQISPLEILQIWLINTVNHSLVNNNKGERKGGEGRGAEKRGGGLINLLLLKRRTY